MTHPNVTFLTRPDRQMYRAHSGSAYITFKPRVWLSEAKNDLARYNLTSRGWIMWAHVPAGCRDLNSLPWRTYNELPSTG